MPENFKVSFTTDKLVRYSSEFNLVNCERVSQADVDGDGNTEIIVLRGGSSEDKSFGEVAIYDLDLNLKASDQWDGTAMDVAIADMDDDGLPEIIVVGGLKDSSPMIRTYKYNEDYKDNLELSSQIAWKAPSELFSTAKAIHINGTDISVLSIVEGNQETNGYVQLRNYDADMELKAITRWTPMSGQVTKWGHCMTAVDIDGDGCDELITLINFRHERKQKADLRVFDQNLNLKLQCETLAEQSLFATCMSAADVDGDGKIEVVIAGGAFTKVWHGATNQLMVFGNELGLKHSTTWKTFRHSWVWDLQIIDVDGDGNQEIVTYGGTSLGGKNQDDANIIGEICVWNGENLAGKDMFIWQSKCGEDTRASRGFALRDGDQIRFAVATSRWSRRHHVPELEIRTLKYKPVLGAIEQYSAFVKANEEQDIEALGQFVDPKDSVLSPIALSALATCGGKAAKPMSSVLSTSDQALFIYAVGLMKGIGSVDELREVGYTITDDWAIVSPFDNIENIGFDKKYPPETKIDLDAFYAGKDRIVKWGKIEESEWESRRGIYIDLAYNYFDSFERTGIEYNWNVLNTMSAAYTLIYVHSPEEMEAQIRFGNTDGIKIWLNDELKFSSDKGRQAAPEQDIVPVSLAKGQNRILLKITNYKTSGWGFYFRITDTDGKPADIRYERPEVTHTHNQMLASQQLFSLLDSQDEHLRYLVAKELAASGDKRGNETLFDLLQSQDADIRGAASLALTLIGDNSGLDTLAESASGQNCRFQVAAGNALKRAGDERADRFSIENLKDDSGENVLKLEVRDDDHGFYVTPLFEGDETAHVKAATEGLFHLGDNISIKYATIESFGIRKPQYRAMGLGGITVKHACDVMAERGFSCCTVSTGTRLVAHRLYVRNGYADRRFPWVYVKDLNEKDAAESQNGIIIRDYTDEDGAELGRIREQYIAGTIGPASWSPRSNFGVWTKVAESDGKVIGYADVYLDPFEPEADINLLHIDADFSEETKAAQELLCGIHRYALAMGKKRINFTGPPMRYRDVMQGLGYLINASTLRHGWVNMFKIIDLPGFMSEISDLLSLRLQKSALAGWTGSIGIKGSRLEAAFAINSDSSVTVEDMDSDKADVCIIADDSILTSLLSGDGDVWEWYRQHILTTKPMFNERIRTLIESLFPVMDCRQGGWW